MIEKILDNYYSKRLVDKLKLTECCFCLDFKNDIEKDRVLVSCKLPKYKKYTKILEFPKKYVFYYLSNYRWYEEDIHKTIQDYVKNEKLHPFD
jgi:hypothetical protein